MNKKYITPEARVEEFDPEDVIMAVSGGPESLDPKEKAVASVQATVIDK